MCVSDKVIRLNSTEKSCDPDIKLHKKGKDKKNIKNNKKSGSER